MLAHPKHDTNLAALGRIEGQVRGIRRMVEKQEYCVDILNQIRAAKSALARVEESILDRHFQHCVTAAVKSPSARKRQEKLGEILALIRKSRVH